MLEQVKNFSEKSWHNYTGPKEPFKKKNIFFGYNGKGKSALAEGILSQIKETPDDLSASPNYRFFNKDYVKDNLVLENGTKIQGVVANFGKDNVDIASAIREKENEKTDTSQLKKECEEFEKKIRDEINRIFDEKKGNASIKKKSASDVIELLGYYHNDLMKATKIVSSEKELLSVQDESKYEDDLQKVQSVQLPCFYFPDEDEIDRISTIMESRYEENQIPTKAVIDWIEEGVTIHKSTNETTCQFCGAPLDLNDVEKRLTLYLDTRKQKEQSELEKLRDKIKSAVKEKDGLDSLKISFNEFVNSDADTYFDKIKTCLDTIDHPILTDITAKCEDFNESYEFDSENLRRQINIIEDNIDKLEQLKQSKEKELWLRSDKFTTILKGSIALEIENSPFIKDASDSLSQCTKDLKMANKKNEKIEHDIADLRNRMSATSDFAMFLNDILEDIGIDFYLSVEGHDYIIKHHDDDIPLTVQMISEGECNLLALLIFYYELFEDDKQKKFKKSIDYIILDDPISSIDDVNKIYIIELINKILECKHPQVFVFTHVWEDFCSICFGKNSQDKKGQPALYAFYEVKKNERTGSYLVKAKTEESPYMHDFREIYNFSKLESAEELSDCEIYHYPNVMRKVLEEFLSMKVANPSATRKNISSVKLALCDGEQNCTANDDLQIGVLLDTCNLLSHKAERHPDQILQSAKYLMKKIKEVDKLHFQTMTRETSGSEDEKQA